MIDDVFVDDTQITKVTGKKQKLKSKIRRTNIEDDGELFHSFLDTVNLENYNKIEGGGDGNNEDMTNDISVIFYGDSDSNDTDTDSDSFDIISEGGVDSDKEDDINDIFEINNNTDCGCGE